MWASTFGTEPSVISVHCPRWKQRERRSSGTWSRGKAVPWRYRDGVGWGVVEEDGGCTGGEEDSQWHEVITLRFAQRGPGNRRLRSQVRAGLHSWAAPPTLGSHTGLFFFFFSQRNAHKQTHTRTVG